MNRFIMVWNLQGYFVKILQNNVAVYGRAWCARVLTSV